MTIRVGNTIIATVNKNADGGNGGGLEVGDIGFAPLGIDETQNKRRYLNGQVISQSQFVSFTDWVKERAALYPSLVTSETNWQAEVTNSPYGLCDKFVIDDTLGTIRLPKYPDWNIREVGQAPVIGNGGAVGIQAGTSQNMNQLLTVNISGGDMATGVSYGSATTPVGVTTDSTKSGIIADLVNANTEDRLRGNWFIQVATGVEESVDVTREIELNNPFFLGMSQYFESEPNNASWLISNGSFHSGATYVSFYEWLLKIYNGTETVDGVNIKANTDTYGDYDYVINTEDVSFRLPLYNGSEEVSGSSFESWDLSSSGQSYIAPTNGRVSLVITTTASDQHAEVNASNGNIDLSRATASGQTVCASAFANRGNTIKVYYNTSATIQWLRFYPAIGNGSLYFYVGETIQDVNVVNASGVLTRVAELSNEYIVGLGMPDYSSMVSMAIDVVNQAPTDGILICKVGDSSASSRPNFYLYFGYSSDAVDIEVARFNQTISEAWVHSTINVLIPKGMFYKFVGNDSCYVDYCPLKGVN